MSVYNFYLLKKKAAGYPSTRHHSKVFWSQLGADDQHCCAPNKTRPPGPVLKYISRLDRPWVQVTGADGNYFPVAQHKTYHLFLP